VQVTNAEWASLRIRSRIVRTSGPPIASSAAKSASWVMIGMWFAAAMAAIHKSLTFIARPFSASSTRSSEHLAAASPSTGDDARGVRGCRGLRATASDISS
jgi:hypothetical protein